MNYLNPYETFENESPEVFGSFNSLITPLINTKGIDQKVKQLIYIEMKVSHGDQTAVIYHVPIAKQAGATRGEIRTQSL